MKKWWATRFEYFWAMAISSSCQLFAGKQADRWLCREASGASLRDDTPPWLKASQLDRMVTGGLSSVDVENFPSHESRRVKVHYRVHDIRLVAHSAHRM
jgi:hypothetical protein